MPPQRSSSNSITHNLLLAQAQQSLLRGKGLTIPNLRNSPVYGADIVNANTYRLSTGSRNQGPQSAANMMLNFAGTPPGAIPPPTISPAMDKYERPKEAHSGSTSSSQVSCVLFLKSRNPIQLLFGIRSQFVIYTLSVSYCHTLSYSVAQVYWKES